MCNVIWIKGIIKNSRELNSKHSKINRHLYLNLNLHTKREEARNFLLIKSSTVSFLVCCGCSWISHSPTHKLNELTGERHTFPMLVGRDLLFYTIISMLMMMMMVRRHYGILHERKTFQIEFPKNGKTQNKIMEKSFSVKRKVSDVSERIM